MAFNIDLSDLIAKRGKLKKLVADKQVELAAKVTVDVHAAVVLGSPVNTGRFRGAWSVETPTKPFENGKIENSVEYGPALAKGHSKQAPDGWIDNAIEAATRL